MPIFRSNGAKLFYEEEGAGFPLIMLHGLHGSSKMMKYEINRLKEYFRIIALDSRGHGKSDKPLHYTLEEHVQDVINLLNHLAIETGYLMGMSMGSYIAQGVAIAVPNRVKKLVLIVPKSHGKTSSMQELFARHAEELEGLTFEEKLSRASKYIFHDPIAVQKVFSAFYDQQALLTSPQEQEAANKALEGFDFRDHLHQITASTLVISGKYDGVNPPERGIEIASRIPGAIFIEFIHSGHAPSIEEPERFIKEVTNFLLA
ncbi:alpha/beta fold hydrolase [Paenibacillus brasilensis]|uniref:3-oxoadipate enol-lactonase n=1 Tax=Paenibacillus brasilensis TaxID=128574 RepID=A0ABU0KSQ9_9BACL|nr:alpha/beta fold hydrolase [Paenibacillus brasilensis]MDQ0492390.1 3-oxoadipate enol-lactonase [Paenibacillus brasilensis]